MTHRSERLGGKKVYVKSPLTHLLVQGVVRVVERERAVERHKLSLSQTT